MTVLGRVAGAHGPTRSTTAMASAASRLLRTYAIHVETLRRPRNGGSQFVRVDACERGRPGSRRPATIVCHVCAKAASARTWRGQGRFRCRARQYPCVPGHQPMAAPITTAAAPVPNPGGFRGAAAKPARGRKWPRLRDSKTRHCCRNGPTCSPQPWC
jgi:hypothetical protein